MPKNVQGNLVWSILIFTLPCSDPSLTNILHYSHIDVEHSSRHQTSLPHRFVFSETTNHSPIYPDTCITLLIENPFASGLLYPCSVYLKYVPFMLFSPVCKTVPLD